MSNIRYNKNNPIDAKLSKHSYYDFSLFCGELSGYINKETNVDECIISDIDFNDNESILTKQIKSKVKWEYSTKLNEIKRIPYAGHTMTDNGYYSVNLNDVCGLDDENNSFYKQFNQTKLILNPLRHNSFYMTLVSEHTNTIDYSSELVSDDYVGQYIKLRGGFYQGFYKIHGEEYQTLPNRYDKGMSFLFWLKKDNIKTLNTLNELYPNNKGMFFYLGTRAENKFWNRFEGNEVCNDSNKGYFTNINEMNYSYVTTDEFNETETVFLHGYQSKKILTDNGFLLYGRNHKSTDGTNKYSHKTIPESKAANITITPPYSYPTNPFLVFGRNKGVYSCGCGKKHSSDTKSGVRLGHMTICDVKSNFERSFTDNNTECLDENAKDISNNSFGFRITDDNELEYRYITMEGGELKVISDKTSDIIPKEQWFSLLIKWVPEKPLGDKYEPLINDKCLDTEIRYGKLMIYINCYLKHVFYNFPEFNLKPLNTDKTKQIGVPYNISLGGGTQGLLHSSTLRGPDSEDKGLLLEQTFAGSFIGGISKFKIFDCNLSYEQIKSMCITQKEQLQPDGVYLKQDEEVELILTDNTKRIKIDL